MSDIIFVGGIECSNKWLDDGKSFSRNFKQGNRVYSAEGISTTLTSMPVGGLGGFTSLYMVDENEPKGVDTLERFLIDDQGRTKKALKPLQISPTLRREMHGNEPRVVEPIGWQETERGGQMAKAMETKFEGSPFNYVSLFSGIGGFEQALNKLGGTCVMASEIDKYANQAYEVLYGHPTVGDVTKVDAANVPDHDLLVGGFPCFAAGTLITTSEGLKPIESVRKGDSVLTHTNEFKKVVVPMVKRKKGIYKLRVQGSPETLITEEHPVYVREMYRTYNTVAGKRTNIRNWREPKWVKAEDLRAGVHYVGMSENKNETNVHNLTLEESWLLGRYAADGYISGRSVRYCVGNYKLSEFLENVKSFNTSLSYERTVVKVVISDTKLKELCEQVGRGAINKTVPGFVLDLPKDLLQSFLDGYMSGDGCVLPNGTHQATSISRKLIYSLAQVVQKLYKTPAQITHSERPKTCVIEGRTVNQNDTYMIRYRKYTPGKKQHAVYIDGMLWCPVRSIEWQDDFDGYVYNFEVENDNSYVANNLTVHNCQAFSVAGKRLGFDDTRGTLFFEIARIAKVKRPKAMLLENVKGLVSHDSGRTLDVIVQTLNDIGYTVDFEVINSKYFGVPQNRERIFVVAIRNDLIEPAPWEIGKRTDVVAKGKRRISALEGVKTFNFDWPSQDIVTTRLRDILEDNVDERYYLSAEKTAKLVAQLEERTEGIPIKEATKKGYAVAEEGDAVNFQFPDSETRRGRVGKQLAQTLEASGINQGVVEPQMLGHIDLKGHDAIKRVYSADGVSPTLTTMGGGHREPKIAEEQPILKIIGHSGSGGQKGHIYESSELISCLTATDYKQPKQIFGEATKYRIRKLTPLECFRLQGFPDEAHQALVDAGISNSQLYKMAGNAVTVNVISAIGKRLLPYLTRP